MSVRTLNTISRKMFVDFHHIAWAYVIYGARAFMQLHSRSSICTYHSHGFGLMIHKKNHGFIDRKSKMRQKVSPTASTVKIVYGRIKFEKDNIPIGKFQHKFNAFDACAIICASFWARFLCLVLLKRNSQPIGLSKILLLLLVEPTALHLHMFTAQFSKTIS